MGQKLAVYLLFLPLNMALKQGLEGMQPMKK
jgi:hypothetical protein